MPTLSKKAFAFLVLGGVALIACLILVYYVYLSPSGLKAREHSDLVQKGESTNAYYTDLTGSAIDLSAYDGELLIVNAWASWSPFTKSDHEVLGRIKLALGDRVTIRAINRKESGETAQAYLESIGKYDGIEYVVDTTDHLYAAHGGYAMPETLIFDSVGNLRGHIRGTVAYDDLMADIQAILDSVK